MEGDPMHGKNPADEWDRLVKGGVDPEDATIRVAAAFGPPPRATAGGISSGVAPLGQALAAGESTHIRPNDMGARAAAADAPGVVSKTLGTIAATGRDIPGVEAVQAGARAVIRRQPYREALADIRTAEDAAPAVARVPARMAGAGLAAAVSPGSTAFRQGALMGAAGGALKADPNAGVLNRAGSAATEGIAGGLMGKLVEMAGPLVRSMKAPEVDANIVKRSVARDAKAGPIYEKFRDLGDLGRTQALDDLLGVQGMVPGMHGKMVPGIEGGLPVVRRAIETVKAESPRLAKLADTDAAVLDAAYKRIGSKAFKAQHGYETGEARDALRDAIEEAAQAKGGSYVAALKPYAKASRQIGAVKQGAMAMRNASNAYGAVPSKAMTDSPEALAQWAKGATKKEMAAAEEGILGRLSREPKLASVRTGITSGLPLPFPSRAVRRAPDLLRSLGAGEPPLLQALRALAAGSGVSGTASLLDFVPDEQP